MPKTLLLALLLPFSLAAAPPDDTDKLAALLAAGDVVTVPPGDYHLSGARPIPLRSNLTVFAHGARFHLPQSLPDKTRLVVFEGADLVRFTWHGGEFLGHVFDPARRENTWEPNATTRIFVISTTAAGETRDIAFRDVRSDGIAGAVIGVHGKAAPGERDVQTHALRVTVESCTLLRSGKFMWDYGYLWQVLTWPEDHQPWEVDRARQYFRTDLVRTITAMKGGDDRVKFDNSVKPIAAGPTAEPKYALTFLGASLPKNILRGRQYFVVEAGPDYVKIADQPQGAPIRFEGSAGDGAQFVHNVSACYHGLYAPTHAGPGKGGVDITCARDVRITGCQLSALGDTMHVQRCQNVVFAGNHILGSRMGAFFLAEFCKNATITGNLIDGTNGSRVMSVEKSCEDVTIIGNTFRNGGRGSWINQPKNFILQGNVFVNNTTKNEPDPHRGRRAYQTGQPGQFPELYFTLHEEGAAYGPVIVRDNIFVLGDSCPTQAVTFAPNGQNIQMTNNTFNRSTTIVLDPTCQNAIVRDNQNAETKTSPVDFNHGRR